MRRIIKYLFLFAIVLLPVCIVNADDRAEVISLVEATSDVDTIPVYTGEIKRPTFTITEGTQAHFDFSQSGWYKKENTKWIKQEDGFRFDSGSWQYRAILKIDGDEGVSYMLNSQSKLKVNGVEWTFDYRTSLSEGTDTAGYIYSPTYNIEATGELEFFAKSKYVIYKSYRGTAAYTISVADGVEGGTEPYVFTKVSGPNWLTVSEDGTINGTPTEVGENESLVVRVTDAENNHKEITVPVEKTILPPNERELITRVEATSNTASIPALGAELTNPTFNMTVGQPAVFEAYSGGWYKQVRDRWELQEGVFTPGKWQYRIHLAVTGEAGEQYRLSDDTVLILDGNESDFTIDGYSNEYMYGWAISETFTVKDVVSSIQLGGQIKAPKAGDDITDPQVWVETLDNEQDLINFVETEAVWQEKTGDGFFDWKNATGKFEANKTYHIRFLITLTSDLYDLANIATFPVTFDGYNLVQFQLNNKTVGEFIEFPALKELTPPVLDIEGYNSKLTLSWNEQDLATRYKIYRSTDGSSYSKIDEIAGTETEYADRKRTFGQTYYYKIKACDATKCSGYSNVVSKKVVPNNTTLNITGATTTTVKLAWDFVNTTGYKVYRSTDNKTWTKIVTITDKNTVTYKDSGLSSNKTYYYKVRAYKKVGTTKIYGAYSPVVSTKTAPKKPTLELSMRDYNEINVTIGASKGAVKYIVEKSIDNTNYTLVEELPNEGVLAVGDLQVGKLYYFRIRSCNSLDRCSSWVYGELKSTTTTPSISLSTTSKKVIVTVNKVNGADGYKVYRATSKTGTYTY